jgi:hypothetical protein
MGLSSGRIRLKILCIFGVQHFELPILRYHGCTISALQFVDDFMFFWRCESMGGVPRSKMSLRSEVGN